MHMVDIAKKYLNTRRLGDRLLHLEATKEMLPYFGECIVEKMVDKRISEILFKRKDQAVTLGSNAAIKVDGEGIQVDPLLLFQRMTPVSKADLQNALCYELCTIPRSLFETTEFFQGAQKGSLADSIWRNIKPKECLVPNRVRYILDGGGLPWAHGSSYSPFNYMQIM